MVSQYCRIVWFIDLNFILLFCIDVNWINEQKAFAQGDVTLSLFATSPCFYEKNAPLWFFGGYNDMGSKTCHVRVTWWHDDIDKTIWWHYQYLFIIFVIWDNRCGSSPALFDVHSFEKWITWEILLFDCQITSNHDFRTKNIFAISKQQSSLYV